MSEITHPGAHRLLVIPVGGPSAAHIRLLCDRLEQVLNSVQCQVLERLHMPEEYYNRQMKAYDAKNILNFLSETCSCGAGEKILGVTDVDLCSPNFDLPGYLYGLARRAGNVIIISFYRLHSHLPEEERDALLIERITKEAMHELGHLLALHHCHNSSCVMSVSRTPQVIDQKRLEYCFGCREQVAFRADDCSGLVSI